MKGKSVPKKAGRKKKKIKNSKTLIHMNNRPPKTLITPKKEHNYLRFGKGRK
jgi:hypothetical protein